jgi:hypothetical protein
VHFVVKIIIILELVVALGRGQTKFFNRTLAVGASDKVFVDLAFGSAVKRRRDVELMEIFDTPHNGLIPFVRCRRCAIF